MDTNYYTITPICLGYNLQAEKGAYTYRKDPGMIITTAYLVWLISGNGHHILVDSGGPNPSLATSMSYPKLNDAVFLNDALEKIGVLCRDIDTVILSHLHWDHSFNLELFPRAKIYVQAEELCHAVTPSQYDSYAYVATPNEGLPGWMTGFPQFVRLDGDCGLFPGIKIIMTPGHTPGHQGVLVQTRDGQYFIASDMYPLFENYEDRIPNGICLSFESWYLSDARIRKLDAKILPGHDPLVMCQKRYG